MPSDDPFWSSFIEGTDQVLRQTAEITAEPDALSARFFAAEVLSSEPVSGLTFGLPYCSVDPSVFADIRGAILRGRIRMRIMGPGDPDFHLAHAVYVPGDDMMKIADGKWDKRHRFRTAIVHEAVHAHHDMMGRTDLRVHQSEAAAYIAETVFTRSWTPYTKNDIRPQFLCDPHNTDYNDIFGPAWELALRIVDRGETTIVEGDPDLMDLQEAIRGSDIYKDNCDQMITADRIRW